ncbi:MAG: transporter substrate binding protein [Chloroflexota bacterium]
MPSSKHIHLIAALVLVANLLAACLKGARPAQIPVETPELFLVINARTADAINLSIADDVLRRADEIFR